MKNNTKPEPEFCTRCERELRLEQDGFPKAMLEFDQYNDLYFDNEQLTRLHKVSGSDESFKEWHGNEQGRRFLGQFPFGPECVKKEVERAEEFVFEAEEAYRDEEMAVAEAYRKEANAMFLAAKAAKQAASK